MDEQEKRTLKAQTALERGQFSIQPLGDHTWGVRNGDADPYTVSQQSHRWACTCPDYVARCQYRGWNCKHIEGVRLTLNAHAKEHTMNDNEHPMTDSDWEKDVLAKLSTPFPAAAVSWKPQTLAKDKTRAMAVAYIDARDVMARLDEVVGPFNWQTKEAEVCGQHVTYLGLKHRFTSEWIWKSDLGFVGGSESENEDDQMKAAKGTASDGLKRAGVRWGIGRYLYALPKQWVDWDADKRLFKHQPTLPDWALPKKAPANGKPAVGNGNGKARTAASTPDGGSTKSVMPDAAKEAARNIPCPVAANGHPEFKGMPLGEVAASETGRRLVAYLASDEWPANTPEKQTAKEAAKVLATPF